MKETKQNAIKSFLDDGDIVKVPILPKNRWHSILQKLGMVKKELIYTLRKIKVGNRERIALRALNIPEELNDGTELLTKLFEVSKENNIDLIYCAAVALQNDRHEPSEALLDALRWVDDEFLTKVLEKGISEIDIQNFLKSIVLIKGVTSMMKTETR